MSYPPGVILNPNIWLIMCVNFAGFIIMDSLVKCTGCGQFRSRSNLARHQQSCAAAAAKGDTVSCDGQLFCSPPGHSRSASKESGAYSRSLWDPSPLAYALTGLSTMTPVILEAVSALLDQHSIYTQQGLEAYLAQHYPEIPGHFRLWWWLQQQRASARRR